jgi:hypothetical protein
MDSDKLDGQAKMDAGELERKRQFDSMTEEQRKAHLLFRPTPEMLVKWKRQYDRGMFSPSAYQEKLGANLSLMYNGLQFEVTDSNWTKAHLDRWQWEWLQNRKLEGDAWWYYEYRIPLARFGGLALIRNSEIVDRTWHLLTGKTSY